jgi:hypothetical protein
MVVYDAFANAQMLKGLFMSDQKIIYYINVNV